MDVVQPDADGCAAHRGAAAAAASAATAMANPRPSTDGLWRAIIARTSTDKEDEFAKTRIDLLSDSQDLETEVSKLKSLLSDKEHIVNIELLAEVHKNLENASMILKRLLDDKNGAADVRSCATAPEVNRQNGPLLSPAACSEDTTASQEVKGRVGADA
ncbi:hypothetical protein ACP4OV_011707 [Aristida adscensionis]